MTINVYPNSQGVVIEKDGNKILVQTQLIFDFLRAIVKAHKDKTWRILN